MALAGRLERCQLSTRNVHADSQKTYRIALFVYLHTPTRRDPAHAPVRKDPPKHCVVIFAVLDCIPERLPDFIAIMRMPSGTEVRERDFSTHSKPSLCWARWPPPHVIMAPIHL